MSKSTNEIWSQRRADNLSNRLQDHRSPFQRDRARILHSAAFRRLQAKTQVMGVGQSDFYRTRLTHSLEAAQIGSGITAQLRSKHPQLAAQLLPEEDSLIESLCLAHDIGHPPFGHGGEIALNYMMHSHGGFEGNGQTFRTLTKLEPYTEYFGMNLTRRVLLGILKYPVTLDKLTKTASQPSINNFRQLKASDWRPAKGVYIDDVDLLNWVLSPLDKEDITQFQQLTTSNAGHHKTQFKSFDCSIMELADDIAYGIHDLEDAIVTGIVSKDDFEFAVTEQWQAIDNAFLQNESERITDKLFSNQHHLQKDAIGALVNFLITAVKIVDLNKTHNTHFNEQLLQYNAMLPADMQKALQICKDFVYHYVIKKPEIQRIEYKGQQVVMELFEAFNSDPERLLPNNTVIKWRSCKQADGNHSRIIADYIAGMTDEFASKIHASLFPSSG